MVDTNTYNFVSSRLGYFGVTVASFGSIYIFFVLIMKKVRVLGLSAFYHDSSACILEDGKIIAAAQEERFSRKKGDADFPQYAVEYCLEECGVTIDEVDHVCFYDKPILKFDRLLFSYIHTAPKGLFSFIKSIPLWLKEKLWVEDLIKKKLNYKRDILFTQHHQSHAASAFFPSPYENAAILTVDGAGEWTTTTIGVGSGNQIKMLKKIDFPHSIGLLYSAFTYYCGFKVNSGEYKLMGLAPYGKPIYKALIESKLLQINQDGSYILNNSYFNYISGLKMISKKFEKLFGYPTRAYSDSIPEQFYMNIAASIQEVLNDHIVKIAKHARELTDNKVLCIAGGVGLNCVSNSHILKRSGFEEVWIQPAAGDAGGSLGAATYTYFSFLKNNRKIIKNLDYQQGSLLGPSYSDKEIKKWLTENNIQASFYSNIDLVKYVANKIQDQKIVGWFQGRMEFGPRALGNRSILADPRSEKMQSALNLKIKFRESFRPFAPSVLKSKNEGLFYFRCSLPLYVAGFKSIKREINKI